MSRLNRQRGVFASTKLIIGGTADLLTDSVSLLREELTSSIIQNKDENIVDEAINKITLIRELKTMVSELGTTKEEQDSDELAILTSAITSLKTNLR